MPPELQPITNSQPPTKNKSVIVLLVLVIIIVAVAYYIYGGAINQQPTSNNQKVTQQVTKEAITFKSVDLSGVKTGANVLPEGFPTSTPVEMKNIFVSNTQIYTDRKPNVAVYTVNYYTSSTVTEKYNEYLSYMTKNGYVFGANGKDVKNHALYGTKGANSLLVVASTLNNQTVVQISYTEIK